MSASQHDPDRGVYGISVAADLVGMGVQSLRLYEAHELLVPARTPGGTRRYSANVLHRLRRIQQLLAEGLNLAGIAMVLDLEAENARLRTARGGAMADYGIESEAPEADLVEQHIPVTAEEQVDAPELDAGDADVRPVADEADWLEQETPVVDDGRDDYPPDSGTTGV